MSMARRNLFTGPFSSLIERPDFGDCYGLSLRSEFRWPSISNWESVVTSPQWADLCVFFFFFVFHDVMMHMEVVAYRELTTRYEHGAGHQ